MTRPPSSLPSSVWPASVLVPSRLAQLVEHVRASGSTLFGDLELENLADDFLVAYHGGDDPELVAPLSVRFAFFARSGSGGQVGLWIADAGPSERWPVVSLDSEGGMMVAGETIEDFIRVIAGHWNPEDDPSAYDGGESLRSWATGIGFSPYERSATRLRELNPATLRLLRWFAEQKRERHAALYPERPLRIDVVPGLSVGPVRLGEPRAELDAKLGAPRFASWQKPTHPEQTAFYPNAPYVVQTERTSTNVTGVTLHAGHHIVALPGAFEPMLATEAEATTWLTAHASDVSLDGNELLAPSLGLKLTLATGYGRHHDPAEFRWVTGLECVGV